MIAQTILLFALDIISVSQRSIFELFLFSNIGKYECLLINAYNSKPVFKNKIREGGEK